MEGTLIPLMKDNNQRMLTKLSKMHLPNNLNQNMMTALIEYSIKA